MASVRYTVIVWRYIVHFERQRSNLKILRISGSFLAQVCMIKHFAACGRPVS